MAQTTKRTANAGDSIEVDGETWKVLGVGAVAGDRTYVHLAHPVRGTKGKRGFIPAQVAGWFDGATLHASAEGQG